MKVRELIEKLSQFDPEEKVCSTSVEIGSTYEVGDVQLVEYDKRSFLTGEMIHHRYVEITVE